MKKCDSLLIFAQNIDRGYTLETASLLKVVSNEYVRSMFLEQKNKKNMLTRVNPQFYYIKVGCKRGGSFRGHVIMMV